MGLRVVRTHLPKGSDLWHSVGVNDFIDCYAVPCSLTPREAARRAFAFPKWVKALLVLRNLVTLPLGLKPATKSTDRVGIFPVASENAEEIIMGFDDRHLDFRVALRVQDGMAYGATWVHRNNLLGRLYLIVVLPFHILIMRNAMSRLGKAF